MAAPSCTSLSACPSVSPVSPLTICAVVTLEHYSIFVLFLKILVFIYFQREEKGGRKTGRETSVGCLLFAPKWGPELQPRHVTWQGTEPMTSGSQPCVQSTEPYQPGWCYSFLYFLCNSQPLFYIPASTTAWNAFLSPSFHSHSSQSTYSGSQPWNP